MKAHWPPLGEPATCTVWQGLLRPLAVEMARRAAQLAQQVIARLRVGPPRLAPDPR